MPFLPHATEEWKRCFHFHRKRKRDTRRCSNYKINDCAEFVTKRERRQMDSNIVMEKIEFFFIWILLI